MTDSSTYRADTPLHQSTSLDHLGANHASHGELLSESVSDKGESPRKSGDSSGPQTVLPKTMTASILHKPMDVRVHEVDVPTPGPHDAIVKVMAVGVCGSDVHYYEHGRIGDFVVQKPLVLGHECAGVVVAVGSDVTTVHVGQRVAVEPGVTCGTCPACKAGRYNLCPDVQFLATPPVDGAFLQYLRHREDFLHPIPDNLSFEEAALIEPFSVGIHACSRAGLRPGSTVAIFGMGPVGLMNVVAAQAFGASEIIVSDVEPFRLQAAMGLGATASFIAGSSDADDIIASRTGGLGVDVAFETAGHPAALKSALASVRRGGKLAVVGLPPIDEIGLNVPRISSYEIDIVGIFRYANTYPMGIRFLASGRWDVMRLVTDRFGLREAGEALEWARTHKSSSLKVMVYPQE